METTVYFKQAFDPQSGTSQSGNTWVRQTFLTETGGQFNAEIAFDVWNNKVDLSQFKQMDKVLVKFNITSHEFTDKNGNSRYSHNIMAYAVQKVADVAANVNKFQKQTPPPEQQMQPVDAQDNGEPLPF